MKTPLRAAVAAAAIAGAGLAGFGVSAAFAQTDRGDDATTTAEAPADGSATDQATPPEGCEGRDGPGLDAMAAAIGIDAEELQAALEDGRTPAEVAEANGVSRADLVDAVVAEMTSHLEQAVENGHLTQAEADERLADVETDAELIVDGEHPEGMGPGRGAPPPTDSTDTSADA